MKGFLVLCYNSSDEEINMQGLEDELQKKEIAYTKRKFKNENYKNIYGYQFFKSKANIKEINNQPAIFVAGDLYGYFKHNNLTLLNLEKSFELIENSKFAYEYIPFDGPVCLCKINNEKIIIQNDLEGYRKLFYYLKNEVFCVSTFLPFVITSIKKNWRIRENGIFEFLCARESKWPLTFIEDLYTLPPISRAEIIKNEILIKSKSFSDIYEIQKIGREEVREKLYQKFKQIIERKKTKNSAVTLSGGYDSNCLVKLYSKVFGNNFTAVSVGFNARMERGTNINNETIYAEKIARSLKIPFRKYIFNKSDFFENVTQLIDAIDQPGHDPTSNFLMNKTLKEEGFELVVNGMGGDANFSNKKNLAIAYQLNKIAPFINPEIFNFLGAVINFRGPLAYFEPFPFLYPSCNFRDLFERTQFFKSKISFYLSENKKREIDIERSCRNEFFIKLLKNAKSKQEIFYSLALFCNPDEFHAMSMAENFNIEILMPFVNADISTIIMNGSIYNKITNRKFEASVFGGINLELLAKSKSGLSIPYSEWIPEISNSVMEYYNDNEFFNDNGFDFLGFQKSYKGNPSKSELNFLNITIWKLQILKLYIEKYNLLLN